jgi:hypothetical protein
MELYNSLDRNYGYNIREAGNQGALPDYLKKQISEKVKLDRSLHPEKYSGENNGFYGKKHSKETLKKMSEIKKGKIQSLETKIKTAKTKGYHIELDVFKSILYDIEQKKYSYYKICKIYNISKKTASKIKNGTFYMYEVLKKEEENKQCKKLKKIKKVNQIV